MLLDLGLPEKSGAEVLKTLRRSGSEIPVLIITARDAISDRVAGLNSGADDYIAKPFDLDELAARIRAVVRRRAGRADSVIRAGDVTLDPTSHRVTLRGKELVLSARELALLEALLHRRGAILSRAQLEESIYGWGEEVGSNAVEVYVHSLRKKLGADFIKTVRGVGYLVPQDR
jgi:two-component system response regulator QseB